MNGIVRRRVMNNPEEKGPIVTVTNYTITFTNTSSAQTKYVNRNFVVGATYTFDVDASAVAKGGVVITLQSNGNKDFGYHNGYVKVGSWTVVCRTQPDPSRFSLQCKTGTNAGKAYVTVTETISRT